MKRTGRRMEEILYGGFAMLIAPVTLMFPQRNPY